MAFTEQEKQIITFGRANGKTREEIESAIAKLRSGIKPVPPTLPETESSVLEKTGSVALGALKGATESAIGTARLAQTAGQGVLAALTPMTFDQVQEQSGFRSLQGEDAKMIDEMLQAKNPEERAGKLAAFGAEILLGGGAKLLAQGTSKLGSILAPRSQAIVSSAKELVQTGIDKLPKTQEALSGAVQTGKEIAERVPRFVGRVKESAEEAAIRSQRIATSPPEVGKAIKVGLDDRVINTVQQADAPTIKAYKEMVDIAENPGKTLNMKQRPEIVAGNAADEQYKLIETKRKDVGSKIGDVVDGLSKTVKAPMDESYGILDNVLREQGIGVKYTNKGVKLDFSNTNLTPAERARVEELYKLATEGGENLSPRQIRDKDSLFSKLQRESRMEGVGDIIVKTDQGDMSLFQVFRDVFSNKLDDVAPTIRELNREYRKYATLQKDIENSIIKSGNFQTTKGVSDAEFAQTNLRRLLSDAQSAADYRAIAKEMDTVSRELGYAGANPEQLITFATELRKIFPETVPQTGFQGGIQASLSGMLEKVIEAGKPTTKDQQKALKELLESMSSSSTQ